MKKLGQALVLLGLSGILGWQTTRPVQATTENAHLNFNAAAVLPDDNDAGKGSFSFAMKPDQERTLTVQVTNQATRAGKFVVEANNAVTASNGNIDYTQVDTVPQLLTDHYFTSMIEGDLEQTVEVDSNSTATVDFKLKAPATAYPGIALGGFVVKPYDAEAEARKHATGMIATTYQYVLGARVRMSDETVAEDLTSTGSTYQLKNSRPAVTTEFTNPQPTVIGDVSLESTIYKGDKEVFTEKKSDLRFAPSNKFNYQTDLNGQQLAAGKYRIEYKIKSSEGTYEFTNKFTVTAKQVAVVANDAVDTGEPGPRVWPYYLSGAVGVLAAALIAYLVWRNRRMKAELTMMRMSDE